MAGLPNKRTLVFLICAYRMMRYWVLMIITLPETSKKKRILWSIDIMNRSNPIQRYSRTSTALPQNGITILLWEHGKDHFSCKTSLLFINNLTVVVDISMFHHEQFDLVCTDNDNEPI